MAQIFHRDFSTPSKRTTGAANATRRRRQQPSLSHRHPWRHGIGILVLALLLLALIPGNDSRAKATYPHEEWLDPALPVIDEQTRSERIARGDTAAAVLGRLGFSPRDIHRIITAAKPVYSLHAIRAEHSFRRVDHGNTTDVYYPIDKEKVLHVHQEGDTWQASTEQRAAATRRVLATGIIHDSLFASAAKAGMSSGTTMKLVDIFSWDIDFARDLRDGDSFRVLYDEEYDREGRLIGTRILAAEFVNQGQHYRAVLFTRPDGSSEYFTPEGRSMRKAYLRAPLKYTRISSRFTLRRKHPILGYTRAHRGVDYAAPEGTEVRAVGDGRIAFIGKKHGYGYFILIQHVNRAHATAYAHLSRFARGLHRGSKVRQGQVIGYVGMTGLATGPHLHFEFRVRGKAVNPLALKRTPARPVPATERARFLAQTAPLLARLNDQRPAVEVAWE